jgi:phosphoglycerate dehydrogenase-like enzyme
MLRVAVLDDYQGVALEVADWSVLQGRVDITVLREWLPDEDAVAETLADHDVVVAMRERTPFPASLLARLPRLRLLITTGMRNASIDVAAAQEMGVTVCGTGSLGTATAEHTWALILGWCRHLVEESANMWAGGWQTTLGTGLAGRTLGVVGLGRIGSQVSAVGRAFGMEVLAWSQNLTDERARAHGARRVDLDELLAASDVLTVHLVLSERTRGLLGADRLAKMKPSALLVNTSRGPIVDTDALVAAVRRGDIAGAAVDVYDEEPLPAGHPLRTTPGILATPHLGYVSRDVYELFYGEAVEDIAAFLDGAPLRVLTA